MAAVLGGPVDADEGVEHERQLDDAHDEEHEDGHDQRELDQGLAGLAAVRRFLSPCLEHRG